MSVLEFFRGNEHVNRCLDGQIGETLQQLDAIFEEGHKLQLDWYITGGTDNSVRCGRRNYDATVADDEIIRIVLARTTASARWREASKTVAWYGATRKREAFPLQLNDLISLRSCLAYLKWKHNSEREGFWPCHYSKLDIDHGFQKRLADALARPSELRLQRIANAPRSPLTRLILTQEFIRNADVCAEALSRARGKCQSCGEAAPFKKRSNGEPYLEVHHIIPLAGGGEDTLENVIAVCPNCHRDQHFGVSPRQL